MISRLFLVLLSFHLALRATSSAAPNTPAILTFAAARTKPYYYVGQVYFASGSVDYQGSGTVVRPSSVLTAGHNVYDPTTGWSTELEFRQAAYGPMVVTDKFADHAYLFTGYYSQVTTFGPSSVRSFAYDAAGLTFPSILGDGTFPPAFPGATMLGSNYIRIALGYGADPHDGKNMLGVYAESSYHSVYGAYWENSSCLFEPGMSGGPVYTRFVNGIMYLTAIVVASSGPPPAGGVRVVDAHVVNSMTAYLK